jgi:hypothetical protein
MWYSPYVSTTTTTKTTRYLQKGKDRANSQFWIKTTIWWLSLPGMHIHWLSLYISSTNAYTLAIPYTAFKCLPYPVSLWKGIFLPKDVHYSFQPPPAMDDLQQALDDFCQLQHDFFTHHLYTHRPHHYNHVHCIIARPQSTVPRYATHYQPMSPISVPDATDIYQQIHAYVAYASLSHMIIWFWWLPSSSPTHHPKRNSIWPISCSHRLCHLQVPKVYRWANSCYITKHFICSWLQKSSTMPEASFCLY